MRNFYQDPETGDVYEYSTEDVSAGFVKQGLVKMTSSAIAKHLAPPVATREQVNVARLLAYADPVTGSDRYRVEADAERLLGNTTKAAAAEAAFLTRREEIAEQNPWPKE